MATRGRMRLLWIVVALLILLGGWVWIAGPTGIAAVLPFLLLAACPLAMMFMMGGMGHDHMAGQHDSPDEAAPDLAGLPRDEQVRALRQEMTRVAWRQEALRHDLEQLEAERQAERLGSPGQ